jgi:ABC-type protease/lipase transport system fused ATPase/permease subunit
VPIFLAVIFMLHPVLGWIAFGGACSFHPAHANEWANRAQLRSHHRRHGQPAPAESNGPQREEDRQQGHGPCRPCSAEAGEHFRHCAALARAAADRAASSSR